MSTGTELRTRRKANEFREVTAHLLAAETGLAITAKPRAHRISDSFSGPWGDVVGIAGMTVRTFSDHDNAAKLSEHLDSAVRAAADDGHEIGVSVQLRQARPAAEAYVTMRLIDFAALIRDRRL